MELVPLLDIELIESTVIPSQRIWFAVRFDAGWPMVLNVDLSNEQAPHLLHGNCTFGDWLRRTGWCGVAVA